MIGMGWKSVLLGRFPLGQAVHWATKGGGVGIMGAICFLLSFFKNIHLLSVGVIQQITADDSLLAPL